MEDQEVNLDFASESDDAIKTLGLLWLPKGDQFCIKANPSSQIPSTKRKVTSEVGGIFDPLGQMAAVTVTAKIIIQQLWKVNLDWDASIPHHLLEQWNDFSRA